MPVLLTSAHGGLARRVALRLCAAGGQVRAYSHVALPALRAAGAFVASGTPDDEGRLEAALTGVHTLIHVGAGLQDLHLHDDHVATDTMVRAAANAGVARIIALSMPHPAAPTAGVQPALRAAKHHLERQLADCPVPTIVVRSSLIDTPALRDALATSGVDDRVGGNLVAPVQLAALVNLIEQLDAARSNAATGHLVVSADGAETMTLGAYAARISASSSLLGRRILAPDQADQLQRDLQGDWVTTDDVVIDAWQLIGVEQPVLGVQP